MSSTTYIYDNTNEVRIVPDRVYIYVPTVEDEDILDLPRYWTTDCSDIHLYGPYIRASKIDDMVIALAAAIDGWSDCAQYKDAYLREKHGDDKGIAKARKTLGERAS